MVNAANVADILAPFCALSELETNLMAIGEEPFRPPRWCLIRLSLAGRSLQWADHLQKAAIMWAPCRFLSVAYLNDGRDEMEAATADLF